MRSGCGGAVTPPFTIDWPLPLGEAAAIAVSGGADSFALLAWAVEQGHPVVALTVDHQLREGSAAEAQAVRTWCSERNIPHETLIWRGDKPSSGIQEAARNARYRLLCEACERMGIEHLFTAHTADDQAETVFMRLRRGAGRGLAGMPKRRRIAAGPGDLITLWRPMLSVRRSGARAYAEEQGLPFVDDPSNEDEKYERVRVRALLAALEQQDLMTVEALCGTAAAMSARYCSNLRFGEAADGAIPVADIDQLETAEYGIETASGAIIQALGNASSRTQRSGDSGSIGASIINRDGSRIVTDASSGMTVESRSFSLPTEARSVSGVVIAPYGQVGLLFFREPAALLGRSDGTPGLAPIPAQPGSKHLYDRRFIVSVPEEAPPGLHLRPLGQLMPWDIVQSTLARQRISTLPCLAKGDQLTHLPKQGVDAVTHALSGWKLRDSFLPSPVVTFQARSLLRERFAGEVIRF